MKSNIFHRFTLWWADYLKVALTAFRGMGRDNVMMISSGMVYSTLIALIPCLTFLVAFLSVFGVLQPFMDFITEFLVDVFGSDTGHQLADYISLFSSNAMSLGVVGLVSFIITGILLVDKIYVSINQIFHTRPSTGAMRRFSSFLTFLIVLAFLIVASFALQTMVRNTFSRIAIGYGPPGSMGRLLSSSFVIWLFLFLLYKAVPAAKIRTSSASIGAITGLVALLIATSILQGVTGMMVSYSVIYGSLASVFIALLYLYVCWFIIFFSAEMVYIHQFRPDKTIIIGHTRPPVMQVAEAVNMLLLIAQKYRSGDGAMSLKELMRRLGVPSATLVSYLADFEDAKMVMAVNTRRSSFVPARPLDQITVKDVIVVVCGSVTSEDVETLGDAVAMDFLDKGTRDTASITIENLLERL